MKRSTTLLLALLTLSACVKYVPTEISDVRPRQRVRLTLDETQLGRLAAYADGTEGTVNGEFLGLAVDSARVLLRTPAAFREVSIPVSGIRGTTLRQPDNVKNFIISAVAVGGVGYLAWRGFTGGGNRGPGTEGSGTDESLIPLFSFGIPFGR